MYYKHSSLAETNCQNIFTATTLLPFELHTNCWCKHLYRYQFLLGGYYFYLLNLVLCLCTYHMVFWYHRALFDMWINVFTMALIKSVLCYLFECLTSWHVRCNAHVCMWYWCFTDTHLCTFPAVHDHHMQQASDTASVCTEDFEQEFRKAFLLPGTHLTVTLTNIALCLTSMAWHWCGKDLMSDINAQSKILIV